MTEIDKIKTLILLSSNRLLHLEKEIFANEMLTHTYVHTLANKHTWYDKDDTIDDIVYEYSWRVIKGRWIEAEHILKYCGGGFWVHHYNKDHGCSI